MYLFMLTIVDWLGKDVKGDFVGCVMDIELGVGRER